MLGTEIGLKGGVWSLFIYCLYFCLSLWSNSGGVFWQAEKGGGGVLGADTARKQGVLGAGPARKREVLGKTSTTGCVWSFRRIAIVHIGSIMHISHYRQYPAYLYATYFMLLEDTT